MSHVIEALRSLLEKAEAERDEARATLTGVQENVRRAVESEGRLLLPWLMANCDGPNGRTARDIVLALKADRDGARSVAEARLRDIDRLTGSCLEAEKERDEARAELEAAKKVHSRVTRKTGEYVGELMSRAEKAKSACAAMRSMLTDLRVDVVQSHENFCKPYEGYGRHAPECWSYCVKDIDKALTLESDVGRDFVHVSQVAALRLALEFDLEVERFDCPHDAEARCACGEREGARRLLASPDVGRAYRERMERLKALLIEAHDVLREDGVCQCLNLGNDHCDYAKALK